MERQVRAGSRRGMAPRFAATAWADFFALAKHQRSSRSALVGDQQKLSGLGEAHEVCLPVTGMRAPIDSRWTFMDGNPVEDGHSGPMAALEAPSPAVFLTGQQTMQRFLKGPTAPINVAIDGLVADPLARWSSRHPS